MRVQPGSTHTVWEEWGVTGVTLGVKLEDSTGADALARATGFTEDPTGSGIYRKSLTFPETSGDYQLIFNDDGTTYAPDHVSTRAVTITSSAPDGDFDGDTFATADELFPILNIRATPSAAQEAKAERVLLAAAGEILRELDFEDTVDLDGHGTALCATVNLQRAAELWREEEIQSGILLGVDGAAAYIAKDTWERHAAKLSTLKSRFGFA